MLQPILFIAILAAVIFFSYKKYAAIISNIKLGRDYKVEGSIVDRAKNTLLIAFGQKKMFKRFIPAIFHFFIYAAFLLTQIELIEIVIDGITGSHRIFASTLGGFYTLIVGLIEVLTVLAFLGTIVFLWRRNLLKVPRLVMSEMNGWPKLDGNLILIGELLLIIGVFSMNGADFLLQKLDPAHYPDTGLLPISSQLGPALFGGLSQSALVVVERFGWWLHILVVFGFIAYLPYSKHLHIFFAFPNVFFTSLKERGEMENMPAIMDEVKSMMGLIPEIPVDESQDLPTFGANDVNDLTWKNLLDAYSCTECGRCSSVCPANITGKKLSPRKIMMDVRDRADEVGRYLSTNNTEEIADEKNLASYISAEEINACTTCNACVEACPILINPLDIILQLRRHQILTESAGPADWTPMFTSLENGGAVWQVQDERIAWTK